jgi:dUTP pyrophosphatase
MLSVKKLHQEAQLPTVNHPGADLGFDLYALRDTPLKYGVPVKVRTGIAAHYEKAVTWSDVFSEVKPKQHGLLIRDRSSMAAKGITVSGGVIDAGYRGEIVVLLTWANRDGMHTCEIKKGDKIAQMIPIPVMTDCEVKEVEVLPESTRGANGFGSSGR